MDVLIILISVVIIYVQKIILLYTLNIHNYISQLFLNKLEKYFN